MAIHPLEPNYIAVGLGNGSVRLLDRRMSVHPVGEVSPLQLAETSSCRTYRSSALREKSYRITSLQFNLDGSQLLANVSEDHVYLFNSRLFGAEDGEGISRPSYLSRCKRFSGKGRCMYGDTVRKKPVLAAGALAAHMGTSQSSEHPLGTSQSSGHPLGTSQSSGHPPPVKKIRLRGDWSDTGPEALPETQQASENERGNLMNQMSQMFTQWVDMSVSASGRPYVRPPRRGELGGQHRGEEGAEEREREEVLQTSSSSDNSFHLFSDTSTPTRSPPLRLGQSDSPTTPRATPSSENLSHLTLRPSTRGCPTQHESTEEDEVQRTLEPADDSGVDRPLPRHTQEAPSNHKADSQLSHPQQGLENSGAVAVETRSTHSRLPTIEIIEGDTDSDDVGSCDRSCDDVESCNQQNEGEESEREDSTEGHLQPFMVYKGHRNSRTMIKQANFWGENWVISGSDCGRVFVWDKWTGEVVNFLVADSHVVNSVQPHPEAYVIATSGIDYNIKLWEPVAERAASLDNLDEIIRRNETMLQESRNTVTVPSTFILRILAYLNRRRRMAGEGAVASGESDSD